MDIIPHQPSQAIKILQFLVQKRIIRRGQSWILKILPESFWGGPSLEISTELGPMCVPVSERSASCIICRQTIQETRESNLIAHLVKEMDVVIDIGSHMGWYARLAANVNPKVQIFAFEPDPLNFAYVEYNLKNIPNAECFLSGVGEVAGSGYLWKGKTSNLNSTVRKVGSSLSINIISLDTFFKERKLEKIDFIKCDTEGAELFVLKGASEILRLENPPIWMLEVDEGFAEEAGYSIEDWVSIFETSNQNYKIFSQNKNGIPFEITKLKDRLNGNNVFFVPECGLPPKN
jgi:FkbM family methyltransferase